MTDSKQISSMFVVLALLLLGVFMGVSVVTNPTGGIAALVPVLIGILSLIAIINPINGLYALAALVIWVDEFKRLAVYFGGAYTTTIYQTLAMPFIILAVLNAGFLLNIVFGKVKIDIFGILFYVLAATVGGTIFLTMDDSLPARFQRAANIAGYISLIPITYCYLKTFQDWRKFFAFQALVALPAATWAIWQYFNGFTEIEWVYAKSGLSAVHYSQMFNFEHPRVFGFFGSASALGCAAIYCAFAWWHAFTQKKHKIMWLLVALIFSIVLIVSTQRTALIYPILILPAVFLFRRPFTTFVGYLTGFVIFIISVFSASWLLDTGLDKINQMISSENAWGERVLSVNTFSDRLRGWERLTKADTYSWFGTGNAQNTAMNLKVTANSEDYNHDIINKILINYGVIGLLIITIPSCFILLTLHRIIFRQQTLELRNNAAFVLALSFPMIALSFVGGDNFNANPINIQIWTALAGVFVCRSETKARLRTLKLEKNKLETDEIEVSKVRS